MGLSWYLFSCCSINSSFIVFPKHKKPPMSLNTASPVNPWSYFLLWARTQCNRWSSSNRPWLHVVHLFTPQCFVSLVTRTMAAGFLQAKKCTPINIIHVSVHSHACLQLPHLCKLKKEILLQKETSKTWEAADCPSVNLGLHLLEAVAEIRSTPTDIKQSVHCGVIMESRKADFSYSALFLGS